MFLLLCGADTDLPRVFPHLLMPGEKRLPLFTLEETLKLCERSLIWVNDRDTEVSH